MHKRNKNYLIFLGTEFHLPILHVEQYLAYYLSKYYPVICFEYPRFLNLLRTIFQKKHILERKSYSLYVFHSIGLFPFGRAIFILNFFNHYVNYLFLRIKIKNLFNISKSDIISFTPEIALLKSFLKNNSIFYYVLDNYISLPWWSNKFAKGQFRFLEIDTLKISSKIIGVSENICKKYVKFRKRTFLFPTPTKTALYPKDKHKIFAERILKKIPKPRIGYIGTIYSWKVDFSFLSKLFDEYPFFSFIFCGEIDSNNYAFKKDIANKKNFFFIGYQPIEYLTAIISFFDVCIIPYSTSEYGQYAYPVKIMEYLALGKPIVTTALPSIKYLADQELIYWSKNEKEFIKNISIALNEKGDVDLVKRRITEAKKNGWEIRIKDFIKFIKD